MLYTTGEAVRARLAEQGVRDYSPSAYREGVFEQSSPAYRELVERVWRPYVDGRVPMSEAVKLLVDAMPAGPR